jgi:endonuclease G
MGAFEERLGELQRRVTPAVRSAIQKAAERDRIPPPLRPALAPGSLRLIGIDIERTGSRSLEAASIPPRLGALEAIVQRFGRPPLLIRDDQALMEDLSDLPPGTAEGVRQLEQWIPSVGRIEFLNHSMAWAGTGWVVGDIRRKTFVVTNRHVAAMVARRKADGSAIFMRGPLGQPYGAAIDFIEEFDPSSDAERTVRLSGVEYLAEDIAADVALLTIDDDGFDMPPPIPLDERPVGVGEAVAIIGYPAFDSRNDADDQSRYFRDLYDVKRLAPGLITQDAESGFLTHDCTTLGGNSGSPLFRLFSSKAIGLHFSGVYGRNNWAVTAATLAALVGGQRPVSVRIAAVPEERPDGHHPADHFEGRTGFDASFLGEARSTPWPVLPADLAADLAHPSDDPAEPNEIRYTHFGVKYSARSKVPVVTAVNIDGGRTVRIKRGDDRWFTDGRLPLEIQLRSTNFADPSIDRGHMVRREDPNWGNGDEARQANDDTFHYVNASAQHSSLNQGKALWQGLENYILDSARTHGLRACVFTGPVLRQRGEDDETVVDGSTVPLEFWKMVVTLDADEKALHATAYLLSQGELVRRLLERRSRREALEGFTLGAYRTYQIAISDLAEATGYDLAAYVGADPLARSGVGEEALDTGEPVIVPVDTLESIVL